MLANVSEILAEVKMADAYTAPGRIVSRYWAITGQRPDGLTMSEMFQTVVAADFGNSGPVPIHEALGDILPQPASEWLDSANH